MGRHLEAGFPGRFSPAMKRSLAQNVNTTWTAGAAPWALRTADEWDNTAMEYQVQPAAGSITPSMTMYAGDTRP